MRLAMTRSFSKLAKLAITTLRPARLHSDRDKYMLSVGLCSQNQPPIIEPMTPGNPLDVAALIEDKCANGFRVSIVLMTCAIMLLEGYDIQVLAYAAPSIIKAWN